MMSDPSLLLLVAALLVDLLFGELPSRWHPVVWMGQTITWLERRAPRSGAARQLVAGAVMTAAVPLVFGGGAWWLLRLCEVAPPLWLAVGTWLLTSTFAARALGAAGSCVAQALQQGSVDEARDALRSLCSRDPSALDEPHLVAATVESLAENASDSFVAPLFYYALFGIGGAVAYRAINTLDAMIGYHGRYEYLGKVAARTDDVVNFIPARLTAGLLLLAGSLLRKDARCGWAIWRRDAAATESPNAGRPMAVMAGLLRVRLEKVDHYRLGDAHMPLERTTIGEAWSIVGLGFGLAALLAVAVVGARHG